jgi:hypothetical protein
MHITLKRTKISLSETPQTDVLSAILVICKESDPIYIDVLKGKQTYRLPIGIHDSDVLFIYLRVF